jgi:hypothetical protein
VSVTETVLVFAGIPLAVVLVISGLAALGGGHAAKRYRPGRPFEFAPVWFLAAPEQLAGAQASGSHASHGELPAGTSQAALPSSHAADSPAPYGAGATAAGVPATSGTGGELVAAPTRIGPTGGASDRW